MSDFWTGFVSAIGAYLFLGWLIGNIYVGSHLAYYFAAGWRWRAMQKTVLVSVFLWPAILVELYEDWAAAREAARAEALRALNDTWSPIEDPDFVESVDGDEPPSEEVGPSEQVDHAGTIDRSEPPEWIWYGEKEGKAIITFGRWPRSDVQQRYRLDQTQYTATRDADA